MNDLEISAQSQEIDRLNAQVAQLREALTFYAEQDHFTMHQPELWDTVSGEPINFYEDENCSATVEDGSIAKIALSITESDWLKLHDQRVRNDALEDSALFCDSKRDISGRLCSGGIRAMKS